MLRTEDLSQLVQGNPLNWNALAPPCNQFKAQCEDHGIGTLIYSRATESRLPDALKSTLAPRARLEATQELLRLNHLKKVAEALTTNKVPFILMKGTPLAYTHYSTPSFRSRCDTDILIRKADVKRISKIMKGLGAIPDCSASHELLFYQYTEVCRDQFGTEHVYDIHWKISNRQVFSNLFTFNELLDQSVVVPKLGSQARALGNPHALILACLHPVMHHHDCERLIWIFDIKLIVESLTNSERSLFLSIAAQKGLGPICVRGLLLAKQFFDLKVPEQFLTTLSEKQLSRALLPYLEKSLKWHEELFSDLGSLGWVDRALLLLEIAFPSGAHIYRKYQIPPTRMRPLLLPVLYFWRMSQGLYQVAMGKK